MNLLIKTQENKKQKQAISHVRRCICKITRLSTLDRKIKTAIMLRMKCELYGTLQALVVLMDSIYSSYVLIIVLNLIQM